MTTLYIIPKSVNISSFPCGYSIIREASKVDDLSSARDNMLNRSTAPATILLRVKCPTELHTVLASLGNR